jgi:hypothetical protein
MKLNQVNEASHAIQHASQLHTEQSPVRRDDGRRVGRCRRCRRRRLPKEDGLVAPKANQRGRAGQHTVRNARVAVGLGVDAETPHGAVAGGAVGALKGAHVAAYAHKTRQRADPCTSCEPSKE